MLFTKDYAARTATITLGKGEEFDIPGLDVAIQLILQDPRAYDIDLVIDVRAMNLNIEALQKRHFRIAGNVPDSGMFIRMRRVFGESGDGRYSGLAITPDPPPKSSVEFLGLVEQNRRIDASLAALHSPEDVDEVASRRSEPA